MMPPAARVWLRSTATTTAPAPKISATSMVGRSTRVSAPDGRSVNMGLLDLTNGRAVGSQKTGRVTSHMNLRTCVTTVPTAAAAPRSSPSTRNSGVVCARPSSQIPANRPIARQPATAVPSPRKTAAEGSGRTEGFGGGSGRGSGGGTGEVTSGGSGFGTEAGAERGARQHQSPLCSPRARTSPCGPLWKRWLPCRSGSGSEDRRARCSVQHLHVDCTRTASLHHTGVATKRGSHRASGAPVRGPGRVGLSGSRQVSRARRRCHRQRGCSRPWRG